MSQLINLLDEIPACAAIQSNDGITFAGKRHDNCLRQIQLAGLTNRMKDEHWTQGFMTTRGRFVTREGAAMLMMKAELKSVFTNKIPSVGMLFSEDLY